MRHISGGAGHILVQYFYTDRYQALEWTGTPRPDAGVVRFKIAVEVYAAARAYELDGLEELAKGQLECEGAGLHAFTIIDAVREAYPRPAQDDFWFPDYMKSTIKTAFQDPASLMSAPFQIDLVEPMSIAKVVFRGMLEAYCEMLELLTRDAAHIPLTEVSFHDDTTSLPVVKLPEPVQDRSEQVTDLTTDERKEQPPAETETNMAQTEDIPHQEPPTEESAVPFSFEDHQADPEVALGFRYPFYGKGVDDLPEVSDGGPSFGDYNEPLQELDVIQDLPDEILHKQELDSKPRVPLEHLPAVEPDLQPSQDPPREVTPDRARSESTPSPKDGDEFWDRLSKRRKERREKGRRGTVTFDLPEPGPPQGESSNKGKEPMGTTTPHSVQEPVTGSSIVPELTQLPYQHQDPPLPSNKLMHGGGGFHHSWFGPKDPHVPKQEVSTQEGASSFTKSESEPGTDEIPKLVPPDPSIWGANIVKAPQNDVLIEEPGLGAELEREPDTPEPTGGDDMWGAWGTRLSTTKKRRKRAMSLSQEALTQVGLEPEETQTATQEAIPHVAFQEDTEPAQDNSGLHVVPDGVDPEPEPMSGASILAQDDTDLWAQTTSPSMASDVLQGQSISKKKRSKKSKRLKALAEEHGAVLTELTTEQLKVGDAACFPVDRHAQRVEVKSDEGAALARSQSQPEAEPEREQDPWDFWGAKRSPSLRKSF